MSYLKYCDFLARVIDEVNDSIVALANPVSVVVASELLGIVAPGVRPKRCDLFDDSATIFLRADGFDFLGCRFESRGHRSTRERLEVGNCLRRATIDDAPDEGAVVRFLLSD
jgi:hypothetical protein